jgi:predicted GNAT family acetyltransferase
MSSPTGSSRYSSRLCDLILEQLRDTVWSLADEVKNVGPGWLASTPSLPEVWAVNQVHITGTTSAAEVIALSDQYQAALPFRHVRVEPEATALEMAATLAPTDWKVDREVYMALMGQSAREVSAEAVVELNDEQTTVLMRRWLNERQPGVTTSRLDQVDVYGRREATLWGERSFGILDDTGVPAAIAKLRSRRGTGWVEDVYTAPQARRRGFARTLVTYATGLARSAGHELVFIIADDNDWPKHLYESIGFRPVGFSWMFHLSAPAR